MRGVSKIITLMVAGVMILTMFTACSSEGVIFDPVPSGKYENTMAEINEIRIANNQGTFMEVEALDELAEEFIGDYIAAVETGDSSRYNGEEIFRRTVSISGKDARILYIRTGSASLNELTGITKSFDRVGSDSAYIGIATAESSTRRYYMVLIARVIS